MANQIQTRVGTTIEHSTFAGAAAEVTVDETKDTAVIHDGATLGGFPLAREDMSNVSGISNAKLTNSSLTVTAGAGLGGGGPVALGASVTLTADVTSVHGRTGAVISSSGDYTASEITNVAAGNIAAITVQSALNELDGDKLALAGGTMVGALTLNAAPSVDLHAATKAYVDSAISGLDLKQSVRVATTANITLSGTQTIDGVVLVAGDRVLVQNQSTASQNGIYDVAAGAWSRSSDADNTPGAELGPGAFVFVEEGTVNANNGFVASGTATGTGALAGFFDLGVDVITWTQFSGAGQIVAGTNLNKNGNTINLDTTLTNFASTGIDDNATTTAITIDASERVSVNRTSSIFATMDITGIDNNVMRLAAASPKLYWETTSASFFNYKISAQDSSSALEISAGTAASASAPGDSYTPLMVLRGVDQKIGIGTGATTPDGKLHIMDASAGAVTASASSNTLVLEDTALTGISILNNITGVGAVYFGDTGNNAIGQIRYEHTTDEMIFRTGATDKLSIGDPASDGTLHVHTASAGIVTASTSADDLVVENSADTGISILSPNTNTGNIFFGDPENNSVGGIQYSHTANKMSLRVNGLVQHHFGSGGKLGLRNATVPEATLDVQNGGGEPHVARFKSSSPSVYWENTTNTKHNFRIALQQAVDNGLDFSASTTTGAGTASDNTVTGTGGYTLVASMRGDTLRMGIGDGAPGGKLEVNSETTQAGPAILVTNNTTNTQPALKTTGGASSGRILDGNNAAQSQFGITATLTHASYNSRAFDVLTTRAGSTAFMSYSARDSAGTNTTFKVDGLGAIFSDAGTTVGSPADYADYFEWSDGNPNNQDRVGYSVVSTADGKIEMASLHPGIEPIGIVSGNPTVAGNAHWSNWAGKYIYDDFNRVMLNDAGEKILNPNFDDSIEYTPREQRQEWDAVGLVGRLGLHVDQPIASTWVKLRNISPEVEEWLVK